MAKKHMAAKGADHVSLMDKYAGKTESRGGFNPIWKPAKAGEEVLAEFVKIETVQGTGTGKKKREDFASYVLKIKEVGSWPITLMKSKTIPVLPTEGLLFTVSGDVIGSALKDAKEGEGFILRYDGLGEAKNGNNAPKLFTVLALVA